MPSAALTLLLCALLAVAGGVPVKPGPQPTMQFGPPPETQQTTDTGDESGPSFHQAASEVVYVDVTRETRDAGLPTCPQRSRCVPSEQCASEDVITYEQPNDIYHPTSQYDQTFTPRFTCGQTTPGHVCCREEGVIAYREPNPFGFPDSLGGGRFHHQDGSTFGAGFGTGGSSFGPGQSAASSDSGFVFGAGLSTGQGSSSGFFSGQEGGSQQGSSFSSDSSSGPAAGGFGADFGSSAGLDTGFGFGPDVASNTLSGTGFAPDTGSSPDSSPVFSSDSGAASGSSFGSGFDSGPDSVPSGVGQGSSSDFGSTFSSEDGFGQGSSEEASEPFESSSSPTSPDGFGGQDSDQNPLDFDVRLAQFSPNIGGMPRPLMPPILLPHGMPLPVPGMLPPGMLPPGMQPGPRSLQQVIIRGEQHTLPEFSSMLVLDGGAEAFITHGHVLTRMEIRPVPGFEPTSRSQTVMVAGRPHLTGEFVFVSDPGRAPIVVTTDGVPGQYETIGGLAAGEFEPFAPQVELVMLAASLLRRIGGTVSQQGTSASPSPPSQPPPPSASPSPQSETPPPPASPPVTLATSLRPPLETPAPAPALAPAPAPAPAPAASGSFGGDLRGNFGSGGQPGSFGMGQPGSFGMGQPGSFGMGQPGSFGMGQPGSFGMGQPGSFGMGQPESFGGGMSGSFGAGSFGGQPSPSFPGQQAASPPVSSFLDDDSYTSFEGEFPQGDSSFGGGHSSHGHGPSHGPSHGHSPSHGHGHGLGHDHGHKGHGPPHGHPHSHPHSPHRPPFRPRPPRHGHRPLPPPPPPRPLLPPLLPIALPVPAETCGLRDSQLSETYTRVFGHTTARVSSGFGLEPGVAEYGDYPWHAAILRRTAPHDPRGQRLGGLQYLCGGTLVSEDTVVTAAHCVQAEREGELVVRLGEYNLYSDREELLQPYDAAVRAVHVHPDYLSSVYRADIAVLTLSTPVPVASLPHVTAACLPGPDLSEDHVTCEAPGWGYDAYKTQVEDAPHALKAVALRPTPPATCEASLQSTLLGPAFRLQEGSFCAAGEHGQDTCLGDGGGGLVCPRPPVSPDDPPKYQLVGVTSWGVRCGDGTPGVYTNVASYQSWIQSIIESSRQPHPFPFLF